MIGRLLEIEFEPRSQIAELVAVLDSDLSPATRLASLAEALAVVEPVAVHLPLTRWSAQLLAELCNYAAKYHSEEWYAAKPLAWALAREMGCDGGWGADGCYYLSTPEAGVCCAHDPFGELDSLLHPTRWPHPWSGIGRQHLAPLLVRSETARRWMASATRPGAEPHPSLARWARGERLVERADLP